MSAFIVRAYWAAWAGIGWASVAALAPVWVMIGRG